MALYSFALDPVYHSSGTLKITFPPNVDRMLLLHELATSAAAAIPDYPPALLQKRLSLIGCGLVGDELHLPLISATVAWCRMPEKLQFGAQVVATLAYASPLDDLVSQVCVLLVLKAHNLKKDCLLDLMSNLAYRGAIVNIPLSSQIEVPYDASPSVEASISLTRFVRGLYTLGLESPTCAYAEEENESRPMRRMFDALRRKKPLVGSGGNGHGAQAVRSTSYMRTIPFFGRRRRAVVPIVDFAGGGVCPEPPS